MPCYEHGCLQPRLGVVLGASTARVVPTTGRSIASLRSLAFRAVVRLHALMTCPREQSALGGQRDIIRVRTSRRQSSLGARSCVQRGCGLEHTALCSVSRALSFLLYERSVDSHTQ